MEFILSNFVEDKKGYIGCNRLTLVGFTLTLHNRLGGKYFKKSLQIVEVGSDLFVL